MTEKRALIHLALAALAGLATACSDGGTAADMETDTVTATDTAADTVTATDTVADTVTAADTARADVVAPTASAATPGARCALTERVGLVLVEVQEGPPRTVWASAEVFDRPDPWLSPPALARDGCAFHRFTQTAACDDFCGEGEVCDRDGACVPAPTRRDDLALTMSAGAATQRFDGFPGALGVGGQLTLPGDAFAVDLTIGDAARVTLAETALPSDLPDLAGVLVGGYDAPTALDVTWTAPAVAGAVFMSVPINHHAGGPTFTECAADAAGGSLHIDGDFLAPLAIATGLEIQGAEHVRFAAAETPVGCVEIRYFRRFGPDFVAYPR